MGVTTLIVGAGPAGLAVGAMLKERGVPPLIVERSPAVGASWRQHYDVLHLHTPRSLSDLPGLALPRSGGRWTSRDSFVAYLEAYAEHHGLSVEFGTDVSRIERVNGSWRVMTSRGEIDAGNVVVATGLARFPYVPPWTGRDGFTGRLLHSSGYRNAEPFKDLDVIVAGGGNSAHDIALNLAGGGAGRVRLSIRTPPQLVPRQALGVPAQAVGIAIRRLPPRVGDSVCRVLQRVFIGDLSPFGMPRPEIGLYSQFLRSDVFPTLDTGLAAAIKRRRIAIISATAGFDGADVLLADGSRTSADVVVAATGYRRGLEPLVGHLGLVQEDGRPSVSGAAQDERAPGMYFVGAAYPISGALREIGIEARAVAGAIAGALGA